MVPEGWYLVQHFAKVVKPGTKNRGAGTKPIRVGTNNNHVFLAFLEQSLIDATVMCSGVVWSTLESGTQGRFGLPWVPDYQTLNFLLERVWYPG